MPNYELWEILSFQWVNIVLRYLLLAGGSFLVFWKWGKFKKLPRLYELPPLAQRKKEFLTSMRTTVLFLIPTVAIFYLKKFGIGKIYWDLEQYPLWYYVLCYPVIFFLHDTYFYWAHRLMHLKQIYRLTHSLHHESKSPTPFTAFSFNVLEAITQTLFFVFLSITIPVHGSHLFLFTLFSLIMNVYGHLGVEIVPTRLAMKFPFKYINTPQPHTFHHQKYNCNYSFYLDFWDRWMNTKYKIN